MLSGVPYEQNGIMLVGSNPDSWMSEEFNPQQMATNDMQMEMLDDESFQNDYDELPTLPNIKYRGYQSIWHPIIDWAQFKMLRELNTYKDKMKDAIDLVLKAAEEDPVEPEPVKMGSLYYYYRTLPKNIQEHPAIRDVYLGL